MCLRTVLHINSGNTYVNYESDLSLPSSIPLLSPSLSVPVQFVDYHRADYASRAMPNRPADYQFYFLFLTENFYDPSNPVDVSVCVQCDWVCVHACVCACVRACVRARVSLYM